MPNVDSRTALTYLMHILYKLKVKKNKTDANSLYRYHKRIIGYDLEHKGEQL